MSTLDEKLEQHAQAAGGAATQTLKQLRTRWGAEVDKWTAPPELVMVRAMDDIEIWRWRKPHTIHPLKDIGSAVYELTEKRKATDASR